MLAALVAGCLPAPRGLCSSDADCAGGAAGLFCAEGVCQGPPRVTLLEVPRGVFGRAATATVRARVDRAHGVATAKLTLGAGSLAGVAEEGGSFRFEVPLSLAPAGSEGPVPISVVASDDLGHTGSAQDVLSVDDRAPRLTVDPASIPAVVRGAVLAVRVAVQDLSAVTVTSASGAAVQQADGSFLIQVDTSRAAPAAELADIAITAIDTVGNTATVHAAIPITRLRWIANLGTASLIGLALASERVLTTSSNANAFSTARTNGASSTLNLGQAAVGDPTTDGSNLISARVDNQVCKIGLDGSLRWCCGPFATLRAGPALLGPDVIIASSGTSGTGGRLYAISDSANGCDPRPTGPPQIDFDFSAPIIAGNGLIYIGAYNAIAAARFDGFGWGNTKVTTAPARYRGSPALRPPLASGEQPVIFARTASALDSYLFPKDPLNNSPNPPVTITVATPDTVITAPTLAEDGTLVVGTQDHTVVALAPDGTQRWSIHTSGLPSAAPTHGAGGVVYIAEDDGTLLALSIIDGATLWSFAAGSAIRTPPALGCDRTLYFGTDAGAVFALSIDESQSGLANSSWPRAGHDVRGTGDARRPLRSATGACLE